MLAMPMAIINIFEFEVCCLIYVGVRRRGGGGGGGGGTVRRSECDDLYAPRVERRTDADVDSKLSQPRAHFCIAVVS